MMNGDKPLTAVAAFEISVTESDSQLRVRVHGELDVATSPRLRTELTVLIARGATDITLEFGEVTFVDSSGLGVLVGAYKRLQDDGSGSISIEVPQRPVPKVFEVTGVES